MRVVYHKNRVPARKLGCSMTKNGSKWCNYLCVPKDGLGHCGRLAPHAIMSRTQLAILKHKQEKISINI